MSQAQELLQLYDSQALELARLASVASRVEPELLRALRLRLLPSADVSAEADVWWSRMVTARSSGSIRFDATELEDLRQSLSVLALQAAFRIVRQVHRGAALPTRYEELITWLALRGRRAAAEKLLRRVADAMTADSTRAVSLAGWALDVLPRLPVTLQTTSAFVSLLFLSNAQGRGRAAIQLNPSAVAAAWDGLPNVFADRDKVEVLASRRGKILFLALGQPKPAAGLAIPDMDPLFVEVSTGSTRRVARVPRSGTEAVEVGNGDVTVRSMDGVVYALSPVAASQLHQNSAHWAAIGTAESTQGKSSCYLLAPRLVATAALHAAGHELRVTLGERVFGARVLAQDLERDGCLFLLDQDVTGVDPLKIRSDAWLDDSAEDDSLEGDIARTLLDAEGVFSQGTLASADARFLAAVRGLTAVLEHDLAYPVGGDDPARQDWRSRLLEASRALAEQRRAEQRMEAVAALDEMADALLVQDPIDALRRGHALTADGVVVDRLSPLLNHLRATTPLPDGLLLGAPVLLNDRVIGHVGSDAGAVRQFCSARTLLRLRAAVDGELHEASQLLDIRRLQVVYHPGFYGESKAQLLEEFAQSGLHVVTGGTGIARSRLARRVAEEWATVTDRRVLGLTLSNEDPGDLLGKTLTLWSDRVQIGVHAETLEDRVRLLLAQPIGLVIDGLDRHKDAENFFSLLMRTASAASVLVTAERRFVAADRLGASSYHYVDLDHRPLPEAVTALSQEQVGAFAWLDGLEALGPVVMLQAALAGFTELVRRGVVPKSEGALSFVARWLQCPQERQLGEALNLLEVRTSDPEGPLYGWLVQALREAATLDHPAQAAPGARHAIQVVARFLGESAVLHAIRRAFWREERDEDEVMLRIAVRNEADQRAAQARVDQAHPNSVWRSFGWRALAPNAFVLDQVGPRRAWQDLARTVRGTVRPHLNSHILWAADLDPKPDANDPNKGSFGCSPMQPGRSLRSSVTRVAERIFEVELEVSGPELTDSVTFHLHPTFSPRQREVAVQAGAARLKLLSWGSFTVGVECDDRRTRLELDLALLRGTPEEFVDHAPGEADDTRQAGASPWLGRLGKFIWRLWPVGLVLKVQFMGGEKPLHERVLSIANEWTAQAALYFVETRPGEAGDVRVSFERMKGVGAYQGTSSEAAPLDQWTVNLDPEYIRDDAFMRTIVLREFGHVLGLVDEVKNPNARIAWNIAAVISANEASSREQAESSVVATFTDPDQRPYRAFDPHSAMLRAIDPKLTTDGFYSPHPSRLSESDRAFIRELYPEPTPLEVHLDQTVVPPARFELADRRAIALFSEAAPAQEVWLELEAKIALSLQLPDRRVLLEPGGGRVQVLAAAPWLVVVAAREPFARSDVQVRFEVARLEPAPKKSDGRAGVHVLQRRLRQAQLPERSAEAALFCVWQLSGFGQRQRSPMAIELIAEVLRHYDLTLLGQVDDPHEVDRILEHLRPPWQARAVPAQMGGGPRRDLFVVFDASVVEPLSFNPEAESVGRLVLDPQIVGAFALRGIRARIMHVDPSSSLTSETLALGLLELRPWLEFGAGREPNLTLITGFMGIEGPESRSLRLLQPADLTIPTPLTRQGSNPPLDQIVYHPASRFQPSLAGLVDLYESDPQALFAGSGLTNDQAVAQLSLRSPAWLQLRRL